MPHSRNRHICPLLLKKLTFSPVVAIQGARQTGKSVLAREILCDKINHYSYVTFDEFNQRDFAIRNPDTYLAQNDFNGTLAIDEAQKVPDMFDAIKLVIDRKRTPGKYLLLGSTEFSKLTRIRESLTGRMGRVRLYPLNMAETLSMAPAESAHPALVKEKSRINRQQLMTYFKRGGFPGIFAVRSESEHQSLLQDWLDLTTQRDVLQIPGVRIDPDLCLQILRAVVTLEEPDATHIAQLLKRDGRRIKTHLKVLTTLFVLNELSPHPLGTGKPMYYLLDVALARYLGASFERQLATWTLSEQLSQRAYGDDRQTSLNYYRTAKGSLIHLIATTADSITPIKIMDSERVDKRELMVMRAFLQKVKKTKKNTGGIVLGPGRFSFKKEGIEIYPWESLA